MPRRFSLRSLKRFLLIVVLAVAGGGFAAHATRIVLEQAAARAARDTPHLAGRPVHGAMLYPVGDEPAPVVGATGTIALPALPAGAETLTGDSSVHPARPFTLAGASAEAKARAQRCLTTAIYYEAASESEAGQRAVAQVVLNRVRHPAFPASVCGVVFQGSERASGCQFSFACDGALARIPTAVGWARAARFAADALTGYVMPAVGEATHYHTYAVTPAWNRSLVMTAAIGAHFFHRWQGYWGTPAAFRQSYAGIEPFPGPAPRAAIQLAAAPTTAFAPSPNALPAYTASGQPMAAAAITPASESLPESTILAKWQGTGQPLR